MTCVAEVFNSLGYSVGSSFLVFFSKYLSRVKERWPWRPVLKALLLCLLVNIYT